MTIVVLHSKGIEMILKKIGKHIFLLPAYAVLAAIIGFVIYGVWSAIEAFAGWLFSDWFNVLIAFGSLWACAVIAYLINKGEEEGLFR